MKITLVSDLHLEFSDVDIPNHNGADVLILGGDIMIAQDLHDRPEDDSVMDGLGPRSAKARRFRSFLKRVSSKFPHVVYIAGNHEFYHGKYPDAIDYLKEECKPFPNIHMLEMESVTIGDVIFIGCTLWTDMNRQDPNTLFACQDAMNDYSVIRHSQFNYTRLRPNHTVSRHIDTLAYIKHVIANDPSKKYVVAGHHAPSRLSIHPRYEKDVLLNGAYSSDLSEFILDHPQIKLWTHGHTHDCFDYEIGSTRIVCNPRGYEGYEDPSGWNPNLILEI